MRGRALEPPRRKVLFRLHDDRRANRCHRVERPSRAEAGVGSVRGVDAFLSEPAVVYLAYTLAAALILVVVNFANQDTRSDRLWVFFDENDVLTHYGASFGTHRTQYAMPWEDVHEASDNQARDAARSGVSR